MLNTHNRQLILISNFANQSQVHVHAHHHPILLVNSGNQETSVSHKLACKGASKKEMPINFFTKEKLLKYDFSVSSSFFERCFLLF